MSTATRVGRLMTMTARPGRGNDLAAALVAVASGLRDFPGCEMYLISQDRADPDTVYVVEIWADEAAANAALDAARTATGDGVSMADVLAMLTGQPHRIDLVPLGGIGLTIAGRNPGSAPDAAEAT
jgi:quinol monooxygenase YgiN